MIRTTALFFAIALNIPHAAGAQTLSFVEGHSYHVEINETLRTTQQLSQVDNALTEPSWRFSTYHFTEVVQKVNPDGSALIASTLDSFKTKIYIAKVEDRNEFFRFNSNNEGDVANRLHDGRALPRAQYLGQTLTYTVAPNGLIKNFANLSAFQSATIARSYDYDMMHAMMSFSDSLRIGQLLEQGNGALAALASGGTASLPYTMTEIHVTKNITAKRTKNEISYTATLSSPPDKVDYLEGIAFPIKITNFTGSISGKVDLAGKMITKQTETDSAEMDLNLDTDTIHNSLLRTCSLARTENKVLHGVDYRLRELIDSSGKAPQKKSTSVPEGSNETPKPEQVPNPAAKE